MTGVMQFGSFFFFFYLHLFYIGTLMTLAPRTTSKRWELEGTLGTSGHERYVLPVELDFPINIITYFFSKEVRRKLLCLYFLDLKYFFFCYPLER